MCFLYGFGNGSIESVILFNSNVHSLPEYVCLHVCECELLYILVQKYYLHTCLIL